MIRHRAGRVAGRLEPLDQMQQHRCGFGDTAAARLRLHAAWVCDDQNSPEEAPAFRLAAIELLERSRGARKPAMDEIAGGDVLLVCELA
jgi:hypothetical protein